MRFDVLTLFPGMFPGYLGQSLLGKAIEKGFVSVHLHDLREWSNDPHNRVDDRPYGGGPGMILMVDPVVRAVEAVQAMDPCPATVVMMTPGGRKMDQPMVEDLSSRGSRYLILCGRYEGFDQRVSDILQPLEISIGDYILNGGEVAAMVMIDAMIRLVPGVLGDEQSNIEDSFSSGNRLLEFPQYTRPREYRGLDVPDVLLGGNHPEIRRWRDEQSRKRTAKRRRDLLGPDDS